MLEKEEFGRFEKSRAVSYDGDENPDPVEVDEVDEAEQMQMLQSMDAVDRKVVASAVLGVDIT